ncbi:MAG: SMC family ATPase [Firmicutes bacterium]|nr:SMC family ATPase [Bacillota bacterium]
MRPILLSFAGINSYREKQTVDFRALGCMGLFGVFGPTGSGKSSLLDAMTLALFGKVNRAERGTQGIINQREEQASVCLRFALGDAVYQVERVYERDDRAGGLGAGVRAKAARLLLLGGEDGPAARAQVLADKPSEVTGRIQSLLGMGMEDFCRAVVLPQGQFDQFLKLSGSERARMLESLFRLEQYGDALAERVRQEIRTLRNTLENVEAEERGLGDSSAEAVRAAEQQVQQAQDRAAQMGQVRQVLHGLQQAVENLRDLQVRRLQVQNRLAELEAQSTAMQQLQRRLERALRAEPARERLEELNQRLGRLEEATARAAEAEKAREKAERAWERAQAGWEAARRRQESEAPQLQARIAACEAAGKDEEECLRLVARRGSLRQELEDREKERQEAAEARARIEENLLDLRRRLQENQQQRLAATVSPEERQRLTAAAQALAVLQEAEGQARGAYDRWSERCRVLADRTRRLTAALGQGERRAQSAGWKARMESLLAEIQSVFAGVQSALGGVPAAGICAAGEPEPTDVGRVAEAVRVFCTEAVQGAEDAQLQADRARDELRRRDLAGQLVKTLQPGQPCPVCGALDHPHPAAPDRHVQEALQRAEQEYRQALERLRAVRNWQSLVEKELGGWESLAQEIREQYEPAVAEARKKMGEARRRLLEVSGGLEARQVLERQRQIEEADRQLEALEKERARLEQLRTAAEADRQRLMDQGAELERQIAQLAAEHKATEEQIATLAAKIEAVVGSQSPAALLAELRRQADSLSQAVRQAEADLEQARQGREQARIAAEQAASGRQSAAAEVAGARSRLEQVLAQAGLESADAAQAAMLVEEERQDIQARLDGYREALAQARSVLQELEPQVQQAADAARTSQQAFQRLCSQLTLSLPELVGEPAASPDQAGLLANPPQLDPEVPAVVTQYCDWARRAAATGDSLWEQASNALAVAREQLSVLQRNHARWLELEKQRSQAGRRLQLAEQLERLVRGRQFVQFLAVEHLRDMAGEASRRLGALTGQRYALELDLENGPAFVMRDDYMAGQRRAVSTLSGGETFLVSLSLALALSSKIQLRGRYPLGFFFLDEGFGTLDPEKLNLVMASLEKLRQGQRMVGLITHVPELRQQVPRYLEVLPAQADGTGSRVELRAN